ncbi:MAG: MucR family transcriptional regulator [Syntrophobacteraceae bacterium]|nr:MucR family transcriptional regulator [Syntrophobacteraceae bacterium]
MIVKLKAKNLDYPDLTADRRYFVIGIEADDYRILNDFGKPHLYPSPLFEVIEPREPGSWITEYGEDGERYSYPPVLNEPGFFEDYFDGDASAVSQFWQAMNERLSQPGSVVSDELPNSESVKTVPPNEGRIKKLLDITADVVKAQASVEPMSPRQIRLSLIETFSTLQRMQRAEERGLLPDSGPTREAKTEEVQKVKNEPLQSIHDDKVVCLECGAEMRQLTAKHLSRHNITVREYKHKWGFALKQPLSAKRLTRARSLAARKRGLPANLVKFLEQRKQKKVEAAAVSHHPAGKKQGKPTAKGRAKARKTA